MIDLLRYLSQKGLQTFFAALLLLLLTQRQLGTHRLFFDSHGWRHRLAGLCQLLWLIWGTWTLADQQDNKDIKDAYLAIAPMHYDFVLGILGITATLTAAKEFPHKHVRRINKNNNVSGTLSDKAIVTHREMMEHAFYQGLNLWQAIYLHYYDYYLNHYAAGGSPRSAMEEHDFPMSNRWVALGVITAPWLIRHYFPVHSFSDNWKKSVTNSGTERPQQGPTEIFLYRLKKAQYLFYKHVVLHGINLSICFQPSALVSSAEWRIFWIALNTSHVMEFFLQSLVKRRILLQSQMLLLNRFLMLVSSVAAIAPLFLHVYWSACLVSCVLNFLHRKHDFMNTMLLGTIGLLVRLHYSG